uniref:Uncharacterized protein n=1 Tax=Hucho hucho TaxID=62062 RepID=A0A4W5NT95_9TELE
MDLSTSRRFLECKHSDLIGPRNQWVGPELEHASVNWRLENVSKAFVYCGLYAVLVFGCQLLLKERPHLHLHGPLVLWSLSLAIFR